MNDVRPGERVFLCRLHDYEVRSWRQTVCASRGRVVGCERCKTAFRLALSTLGWTS